MRLIMSPAASLAPPNLLTLSHKQHDFQKTFTSHKICVLIFSTNFILNLFLSKKNEVRYFYGCENVFV